MNYSRRQLLGNFVFAVVSLLAIGAGDAAAAITCSAQQIQLPDAFAGQQLLVSENGQDITRSAAL